MTRKDQLPLPAALALLAREQMSGQASPAAATPDPRELARHARRAGRGGARRDGAEPDRPDPLHPRRAQAAGRARPGRSRGRERADDQDRTRARTAASSPAPRTTRNRARATARATPTACSARSPSRWRPRPPRTRARTTPRRTPPPPRATTGPAARSSGARSRSPTITRPTAPISAQFDEEIDADDLCDADELTRLRQQLDQQLQHLQGVVSKLANRLQRRLMAQQTRAWEFDLEEGMLDAGRLARVVVNPLLSLSYKRERETDFRDTVVTLLIDNSGSHARPADHGGGDVRRHPGAHAGALRGQGGDPRLHHARLEGRPEPRALGAGRQAAQSRAG